MKKLSYAILLMVMACDGPLESDQNSDPEYVFDVFCREIDRHYSFFEYKSLDWELVKMDYKSKIRGADEQTLFDSMDGLLDELGDPHTLVYASKGVAGPAEYFNQFPANELDDISGYFSVYTFYNRVVDIGQIKDRDIGYVKIKSFDSEVDNFQDAAQIIQKLPNESLIIDVRSNRGGLISNTREVLAGLIDSLRYVAKYRNRNGVFHNDFSAWEEYFLSPVLETPYNGDVIILTNRQSFSACEWFVLGAQQLPNVTIVGDTTGGGSAVPILRELPNGWMLRISNTQLQLPDGRDFQFTGLYPDVPVWIKESDILNNRDAILETAIGLLSK